ncbi:hypothetical protein LUZ60_006701 [Juncus effusus]|nr:hypothetical protein LUZ60_006701 [Juncus effusus]
MKNSSTAAAGGGSPYGTIRASAPPSPAPAMVDPLPRASPPSYAPSYTTYASSAAMPPSYTTYAASSANPKGYIKVPTSDPSTQYTVQVNSAPPQPVPELQPSPAMRVSDLFTNLKEQGNALIAARRPWQELLHPPSFSRPANAGTAITRIGRNTTYFRANYIITMLSVLLVSLLYHPFSFFACGALFAAWFFLYFSRTGPLTILGKTFDDGSVLMTLGLITIFALLFTNVGWSVIGSLVVGAAVVGVHAAFRSTDDLFISEQEATGGGLVNQVTAPFVRMV